MSPQTQWRTFTYAYPWEAQTLHSHISYKSWIKTVIKPASPHIFNSLLNFLMGSESLTSVGWCLQPIRQLADGCKCWFGNDSKRNNFKNCITACLGFIMNAFFVINHGPLTARPCPLLCRVLWAERNPSPTKYLHWTLPALVPDEEMMQYFLVKSILSHRRVQLLQQMSQQTTAKYDYCSEVRALPSLVLNIKD